jgi:hypothetical protein
MSSVALHVHQAYKRIGDQHAEIQKVSCRCRAPGVLGALQTSLTISPLALPRPCSAARAAHGSIWMTCAGRAGGRTSQRGNSRARSVDSA